MNEDRKRHLQELIQIVLSGQRNDAAGVRVYQDEPILRTAAQMARHTPPKFREMRKIARNFDVYSQSTAMVFYTQALFMADFQDDFPEKVPYFQYYPNYQSMSDQQLRCYFTWRTRLRSGQLEQTALSYVYVYIYELLNGVGVASPREGYDRLWDFWQRYRVLDAQVDRYMSRWLRDYVVYHGLDPALVQEEQSAQVLTLLHYDERTPAELCTALSDLSSYRLENSRFYKKYPDDMAQVVYRVYAALSDYYDAHRKHDLCERLIGRMYTTPYTMFQSAVFYQQKPHPDTVYEINELHRYQCSGGSWKQEQFFPDHGKSRPAGALLKEIDYQMRQVYGMSSTLKPGETTKLFRTTVERELAAWMAEKQAAEVAAAVPVVNIDLSRLQDIRRAALETQNKLIVDEEPEIAPEPVPEPEPRPADAAEETVLPPAETRLLRCLLYGQPTDWVRAEGLLPSVLVDSINELLYDRFADTVLDYDGDRPVVIEDYIDELKEVFRP